MKTPNNYGIIEDYYCDSRVFINKLSFSQFLLLFIVISLMIAFILFPYYFIGILLVSISILILLGSSFEENFSIFLFILISIATYSIKGDIPGSADFYGKISIGNILLLLGFYVSMFVFNSSKNDYASVDKRLMNLIILLLFIFILAIVWGIFINSNSDIIAKEINAWLYFIIGFPLFYFLFKKFKIKNLDTFFRKFIFYAALSNIITFFIGLYGVLYRKNIYLGWLDPVFAGRQLPPTWRTWRIMYGGMILLNLIGTYSFLQILYKNKKHVGKDMCIGNSIRRDSNLIWYLIIILSSFIIGFSQTRVSIVGYLLSILVALIISFKNGRIKASKFLIVFFIFIATIISLAFIIGKFQTSTGGFFKIDELFARENLKDTYRIQEVKGVVKTIIDNKFIGSGVGSTYSFYNPKSGISNFEYWLPHNAYLYLLHKIGIIGLIIYLYIWLKILKTLLGKSKSCIDIYAKCQVSGLSDLSRIALFAYIISLLFENLFSPSLVSVHGFITFSLIICFVVIKPRNGSVKLIVSDH